MDHNQSMAKAVLHWDRNHHDIANYFTWSK